MVRNSLGIKFFLVLVMVMLSAVTMAPSLPILSSEKEMHEQDSAARVEKSTNLSRITGTGRKIRIYIKHKYLQLFADGTVNATDDDGSDYTILQRTSMNAGRVKIQGVATCTFLCMDSCGLLYSTRDFSEECVFNEMLEHHYYNTYSSTKYSDNKRSMYIAISKRGTPRKVQVKANSSLGELSSYTKVLPQPVEHDRIAQLENKLLTMHPNVTMHPLRHHQLCPPPHHVRVTISVKCKNKKKRRNEGDLEDNSSKMKEIRAASSNKKVTAGSIKKIKKKRLEKKKSKHGGKVADDDDPDPTNPPDVEIDDGFEDEK